MSNKKRLDFLDSIRGIATILVFIQHVVLYLRRESFINLNFAKITLWTVDFLDFGKIGVVLFFMLSGFLIPFSLKKNSKVKDFVLKRFFRLYPIFWVSIILGVLLLWNPLPSLKTILANITMVPEMLGFKSIIGVYWTLQIELIFYAFCVILFVFGSLHNFSKVFMSSVGFLLIAFVGSVIRYYLQIKLPIALFLALSLMFYGYILKSYILYKNGGLSFINNKNSFFIKLYPIVFSIIMLAISFLAYNKDYGHNEVWYKYFLSYTIAFILFLLLTIKIKIKNKALSYFGKISYSFYLFHVLGIHVIGYLNLGEGFLSNILFLILSFILSTIISILGFNFIEQKFIKIGYNFIKR
ncbi:acyltransferase family protein [Algibacter sp. R77976]|uniref:acyltransferase family protein n=1 Tax=Algibacter sp. R77976 TaxID=3093873 RepID=UPI0037CC31A4